ncbi:MAG TPA: hypothetical protein VF469_02445 [Kofleriaceae bacterium]
MRTSLASILLVGGLAACGGGSLDPGAGNDAGSGTGTLTVDGSAHASPRQINARTPTDFDTEFSVRVSLNNQTVTTGTVTITSATGKTPLAFRSDGRWSGSTPGSYDQVYVLDVVSGPDKVDGVRVDGPDIHVFSKPTEGATVDATMPLSLAWSREDQASMATLNTETIDAIAIPDTGSYSLAPGSLQTDKSQARPNKLKLTRTNSVVPKGAAAGSAWVVTIDNSIDVVAQPQALPL